MPETESSDFESALIENLPDLRAFATAITRNPDWAKDLVQETVVRALRSADSYKPGTNFRAWLFTILRNIQISDLRKQKVRRDHAEAVPDERQIQPASQEHRILVNQLEAAVSELPEDQREVLILVTVNGFSYEEAADVCGCAVGTVKSRLSRARQTLRDLLGEGAAGNDDAIELLEDLAS